MTLLNLCVNIITCVLLKYILANELLKVSATTNYYF